MIPKTSTIFKKLSLPSCLSLLRGVLCVPLLIAILQERFDYALLILLLAGVSDFLDGFLARKMGTASELGARLDALCDKILLITLVVSLGIVGVQRGMVPLWFLALIFLREIILLTLAGYAVYSVPNLKLRPTMWGKLTMALYLLYFGALFLTYSFCPLLKDYLNVLLYLATFFSLFSLLHYIKGGIKHKHKD